MEDLVLEMEGLVLEMDSPILEIISPISEMGLPFPKPDDVFVIYIFFDYLSDRLVAKILLKLYQIYLPFYLEILV